MLIYTSSGPGLGWTCEEAAYIAAGRGSPEEVRAASDYYYSQCLPKSESVIRAAQQVEQQVNYYLDLAEQARREAERMRREARLLPPDMAREYLESASQYEAEIEQWMKRASSIAETVVGRRGAPPEYEERISQALATAQARTPTYTAQPPYMAPAAPAQPAPQPAQPSPAPSPQPATQPAPAPTAATYRPTVTLVNLSRPGAADFQVGDRFRLTITGGPPNAEVVDTATHNGRTSSTLHGRTDSAGNWYIEGVMASEHVGTWAEAWTVGGIPATPSVISFRVNQWFTEASQPVTSQPPDQPQPQAQPAPQTQPPAEPETRAADPLDRLKEFAARLPWYAWAGIAAGLLLLRRS